MKFKEYLVVHSRNPVICRMNESIYSLLRPAGITLACKSSSQSTWIYKSILTACNLRDPYLQKNCQLYHCRHSTSSNFLSSSNFNMLQILLSNLENLPGLWVKNYKNCKDFCSDDDRYLREFDRSGSGDDEVTKAFGDEREQAISFWEFPRAQRCENASKIHPQNLQLHRLRLGFMICLLCLTWGLWELGVRAGLFSDLRKLNFGGAVCRFRRRRQNLEDIRSIRASPTGYLRRSYP